MAGDPSPFSHGCIGKPPRASETRPRGRLDTRLSHFAPVLSGQGRVTGLPRSSLTRATRGHSPACPAAPSTALPLVLSSPAPDPAGPSLPRPGPALPATGPVPPGRWRPGDRLVEARVRARGAEGGRPVGDRGRPAHLSAARPARPAARGLLAAAPVPGDRAKHAGTAEEGDGKKRRHGRAGPETAKKSGRGLGGDGS